jgi:hypothetical protein
MPVGSDPAGVFASDLLTKVLFFQPDFSTCFSVVEK